MTDTYDYEFHPIANIFPLMGDAELTVLADDIRAHGLRETIWLKDGRVIDGRNRWRACTMAGVQPRFRPFYGEENELLAFVVSLNLHRRHLSESQRAMCASRVATMRQGARTDLEPRANLPEVSAADAASMFSVSERSVKSARAVRDHGSAELIEATDQGHIPVSLSAKLAKSAPEFQQAVIREITKNNQRPMEAIRIVKADTIKREAQIGNISGKFRVIYADPPWEYGNRQPDDFREARDHYPTLSLQEICDYRVAGKKQVTEVVEDDAVLFIWVTSPILMEAAQVIEDWGFKYKASFVWDKIRHVMGHYNSVRHELLLICTRGACQPDVRKQFDSVVTEERTTHSRKPKTIYEIVEALYPHGRRIELFARSKRDGWETDGYEQPSVAA